MFCRVIVGLMAGLLGVACSHFSKAPPQNTGPSVQEERFESVRILEDKGRWEEADAEYRSIRDITREREPRLAALSEWRLSFVTEAQGDDFKALAHLLGAEKHSPLLSEQIVRVELPARKALFLHRLGRGDEARAEVLRAQKGLEVLLSGPRPSPGSTWLAKLYYEMGQSLSTEVSEENFQNALQALALSQRYLLRSVALSEPHWSQKAFDNLRVQYTSFWNYIVMLPAPSGMDPMAASRQKRVRQIPLLAEFLRVIEEGLALAPPTAAQSNRWQNEFAAMATELQDKARRVLYANSETTVLTEESRLLNGLRRAGQIKSPAPVPKEAAKPSAPDPNL